VTVTATDNAATGGLREWLLPLAFVVCAGWTIWHMPAFILDLLPPADPGLVDQITELHQRKDVLALPPVLTHTDFMDWLAVLLMPVIFFYGAATVKCAPMEYPHWRAIDRIALMFGRVTMMLIILATMIMLYEVFLRYAIEAPTLWANELTLWLAGYVFLFSGLYAMQQRCHIRIFLLYDVLPRWLQHVFDIIGAALLVVFAAFLIYGSYYQVFVIKFYRWEMFGTAFDPPIPATEQPAILVVIALIAIQACINVAADWHLKPAVHTAADDIDKDELAAIKRGVGGTGDTGGGRDTGRPGNGAGDSTRKA